MLSLRNIVIAFVLIMFSISVLAQSKHKIRKSQVENLSEIPDFHMPKDEKLINNLDTLKFDSVKIFSFGCKEIIHPKGLVYKESRYDGAFMLGEGFIDSTQHWLPLLSDNGQMVKKDDVDKVLNTFKNIHIDDYRGMEPVGCFEPHMGIMFFKDGIVNAHMDVCLTCDQIDFEIFKSARVLIKYHLGMLGVTTKQVFKKLNEGYFVNKCR